jgi:hypothetical protein
MQHIRSSIKGVFLLQHHGVPLDFVTDFGETIIEGSLCVDIDEGNIYILKNGAWIKVGSDNLVTIDYIRPNPTKTTIGGLIAGTIPNFPTVQAVFDAMLYPFTPPSIGLSSSSLHEKGLIINKTMSYSVNPNDATVTDRYINFNGVLEQTILNNSGTHNGAVALTFANAPVQSLYYTHTYSFVVSYSNYSTGTSNITVSFVPPQYYGVLISGDINETNIKTLTKQVVSKQNLSASFSPVLQRYIYAYPSAFGDLTQIIDQNNFNITAGFTKTVMDFTLVDGITHENYNVYSSNSDTTQTGFGLTFKF